MLKKRFASFILALSVTASAVTAFSANSEGLEGYEEYVSGNWIEVVRYDPDDMDTDYTYIGKYLDSERDNDGNAVVRNYKKVCDEIRFSIPEDKARKKIIQAMYYTDFDFVEYTIDYQPKTEYVHYRAKLLEPNPKSPGTVRDKIEITMEEADELYNILKDVAVDFEIDRGYIQENVTYLYPQKMAFGKDDNGSVKQSLEELIEEDSLDAYIEESNNRLYLIFNDEISPLEQYNIMQKIDEKTSYSAMYTRQERMRHNQKKGGENIGFEVFRERNAVIGDANLDDTVSIADATAILQALGNPDKYSLSAQGKYNADVYGNGDGITPMDAVTIQQYNANVIKSF